jgi:ABC-type nitrate/sulfonate/bicarbonate transport system substrate-binding protein
MGFSGKIALSAFLVAAAAHPVARVDAQPLRKVRMAFTSMSSVMCPPWIARAAGIFNKHGLDVEVIATPTGVEGMNALIAGELQFLQISGGTSASAASTALAVSATTASSSALTTTLRLFVLEYYRGKAEKLGDEMLGQQSPPTAPVLS